MEIPKFYAPVTNLLAVDKTWSGMRTVGELRRDKEIAIPVNKVRTVQFPIVKPRNTTILDVARPSSTLILPNSRSIF